MVVEAAGATGLRLAWRRYAKMRVGWTHKDATVTIISRTVMPIMPVALLLRVLL
jgi:uncharacterized membrane protein SpoIIM required for sporulation